MDPTALRTRAPAWLALVVATGLVAFITHRRLAAALIPAPGPPAEPEALLAWLTERAPEPDAPALAEGAWPDVAGNPPLARWAAARIDRTAASPAVLRGLAAHALPESVLLRVAPEAGLDTETAAVLLHPELAARIATGCPDLGPGLGPVLCDAGARTQAAENLHQTVAGLLGSSDEHLRGWGIELAIGLGPDGAAVAERALPVDDKGRAAVLIVQSWTLPPDAAEAALVAHARPDDPLMVVAALELARLGRGADTLEALQPDLTQPADAALVTLCADVAARRVARESPPTGFLDGGL